MSTISQVEVHAILQGVPKVMCQKFGLISQLRIVRFQKFLRERAGIFTHSRNMSKAIKSKFIFSNERSFFSFFYRFLCLDQVHFYMFVFGPPSFIISEKIFTLADQMTEILTEMSLFMT